MDFVTLGRTGLRVSVMGLGAGGPSRVGQSTGHSKEESVAVVRRALDSGVNFIDTAEAYGTEEIVGQAIRGYDRSRLVLSTKKSAFQAVTPEDVRESLEVSLQRLGTDWIDIYHLHGVVLDEYDALASTLVPVLHELRDEGKIRYIGITERFHADPGHLMLQRALEDDCWDVMMVGFNLLNQSARERVLARTSERGVGVLNMFAVRLALSRAERLHEVIQELIEHGQVDPSEIDMDDPLGFLIAEGGATSVVDAAYRFCRYEPGMHVVLSGTGSLDHLNANLESLSRPPLSAEAVARVSHVFRMVDAVSGQ